MATTHKTGHYKAYLTYSFDFPAEETEVFFGNTNPSRQCISAKDARELSELFMYIARTMEAHCDTA